MLKNFGLFYMNFKLEGICIRKKNQEKNRVKLEKLD